MTFNLRTVTQSVGVVATVACLSVVGGQQQAQAFNLGGWDYAVGSSNSGTGGSIYELFGIAVKDTGSKVIVAVNGNMSYKTGDNTSSKVTYGDLFFNFTGKNFKTASDAGQLLAVRFAQSNSESGAASTGLYGNVTAKSVTSQNSGWSNLSDYTKNQVSTNHGNSYGDLNSTSSYFDGMQKGPILTSIATGTKLSNIAMLTASVLGTEGLNLSALGGSTANTFGFSFDKPQGFEGNFIANMFLECGNDGLAISAEAVPEPTTMAGMALAGGGLAFLKRRQKKQEA